MAALCHFLVSDELLFCDDAINHFECFGFYNGRCTETAGPQNAAHLCGNRVGQFFEFLKM